MELWPVRLSTMVSIRATFVMQSARMFHFSDYFLLPFSDHFFLPFSDVVDGGHRAVIFDRFTGIKPNVVGEGTHFLIPWVQKPIIFDIRSRPRNVPSITGSKGKFDSLIVNVK